MSIWQNRIAFKNSFSLPSHGQLKRRNINSKVFTSQQQDPYKQDVATWLKLNPVVNLGPKVKNKPPVKKCMQFKCEENINDETEINVETIKEMEFSDDSDIETLRSAPLSSEWTDIDHETLKEIKNLKYIVNSASVSDHLEYDMPNSSCKFFKSSTPREVPHTISANELDLLPTDISPIQRLDPWKKHQNKMEETPEPNKKSDFSGILARTIKDVRRFRKSERKRNAPASCTARRKLTKIIKDNLKAIGTKPDYSNENRVLKVLSGNSDGRFSVAQGRKKKLKIHTSKKETVATRALPQDSDDCWNARSSIGLQVNNDNSDLLEDQEVAKKVIKPKAQFTSSEKNKLCAHEMGLASNLGKINRKKTKFPVDSLIIRKSKKNLKLPKTTKQLSVEFCAKDYSFAYNTGTIDKISEKKYLVKSTTISQSDENTKKIEVHFSHEFVQQQNDLKKEKSNCSAMNTQCAKSKPEESGTAACQKMTSNEFIPQGQNDIPCSEIKVALNSCLTSTPLYPKNRGTHCMPNISEIHKPAYSDLFQTISHEMVSESAGESFEERTENQSKPCLSMQKYPICCIATLTDFPIVHYPIPIRKVFNVPPFLDAYEIDILAMKF